MAYKSFFWSSEETFNIESFSRNSSNSEKYLKFHCHKVESTRNCKLRRLSGRLQTLIWRPGETVQNRESPGLSGRVDSTDLNLPHYSANSCFCKNSRNSQQKFSVPKTFWVIYVQKFSGFLAPPLRYSKGQQKSG